MSQKEFREEALLRWEIEQRIKGNNERIIVLDKEIIFWKNFIRVNTFLCAAAITYMLFKWII